MCVCVFVCVCVFFIHGIFMGWSHLFLSHSYTSAPFPYQMYTAWICEYVWHSWYVVSKYVRTYGRTYVCMYEWRMFVCIYVFMCVCMYACCCCCFNCYFVTKLIWHVRRCHSATQTSMSSGTNMGLPASLLEEYQVAMLSLRIPWVSQVNLQCMLVNVCDILTILCFQCVR